MKSRAQTLLEESRKSIAEPVKKELFARGEGNSLYRTNRRDLLIQELTPLATANGKKRPSARDINILRAEISSYLFEYLRGFHIPTHFVSPLPGAEMLVKYAEPIPLAIRVYNTPDEEMTKRLGWPTADGTPSLEFPIVEHALIRADGTATWVNEYHVYALGIATPEELKQINRVTLKVNAVLRGLSDRRELGLNDLRLTFGRYNGQIVLTGELSPVNCSFVDVSRGSSSGRPSFKPGTPGSEEAIDGLCGRLKLNI